MEIVYEELLHKYETLSKWAKENLNSVNRLIRDWERLHSLYVDYQYAMQQHVCMKYLILLTSMY